MKIGFIGLGIMGSRMAANLQKQGYQIVAYNRTPAKAEALVQAGATGVDTPAEVAQQVDTLFTMLAHRRAVREMALGLKREGKRPYTIVFLTDGKPTIGITDQEEILTALKKQNEVLGAIRKATDDAAHADDESETTTP